MYAEEGPQTLAPVATAATSALPADVTNKQEQASAPQRLPRWNERTTPSPRRRAPTISAAESVIAISRLRSSTRAAAFAASSRPGPHQSPHTLRQHRPGVLASLVGKVDDGQAQASTSAANGSPSSSSRVLTSVLSEEASGRGGAATAREPLQRRRTLVQSKPSFVRRAAAASSRSHASTDSTSSCAMVTTTATTTTGRFDGKRRSLYSVRTSQHTQWDGRGNESGALLHNLILAQAPLEPGRDGGGGVRVAVLDVSDHREVHALLVIAEAARRWRAHRNTAAAGGVALRS